MADEAKARRGTRGPAYVLLAVLTIVIAGSIWGAVVGYRQEKFLGALEAAEALAADSERKPEEFKRAEQTFDEAYSDPRFADLSEAEKARAYWGGAWTAIRREDYLRARERLLEGTRHDGEPENWFLLAQVEKRLDHHDAASQALATYLQRWPDKLDDSERVVLNVLSNVDRDTAGHLALLQILFDLDWHTLDSGSSEPWRRLALACIAQGKAESARKLIARIDQPETLVKVRSDKRFDGLYERDAVRFDPVDAAHRRVAAMQQAIESQPDRLQAKAELYRTLISLGRDEEVVAATDELLAARVGKNGADDETEDPEQLPWVLNLRADALLHVGRIEEGLAVLRQAADMPLDGKPNVNQVLNLAWVYCQLGRADEVTATAGRAGDMNAHGLMTQVYLGHCAARLRHDPAEDAKAMRYLREHHEDGESLYLWALMEDDRADEAARQLIACLRDEEKRPEQLFELQDFLRSRFQTPIGEENHQRWQALLARPDVAAAIDAVGRRESYAYHSN